MTAPTPTPPKPRGGWKPGQSGNPAGKAPGSGRITKLRTEIAAALPGIIDVLVAAAKAGDTQAARCLMDRGIAALRPIEPVAPFRLRDGTLTSRAEAVVAAIAAGTLSPTQGSQIVGALVGVARVADTDEILRRIELMEARFAADRNPA